MRIGPSSTRPSGRGIALRGVQPRRDDQNAFVERFWSEPPERSLNARVFCGPESMPAHQSGIDSVIQHNDALKSLPSAFYRERMHAAENLTFDLSI
jgi:hypothetical protein